MDSSTTKGLIYPKKLFQVGGSGHDLNYLTSNTLFKWKTNWPFTCKQEFHALNSSPVRIMGTSKKGNPTTVEQNNISICYNQKERKKKRSNSLIETANCLVTTHFQIYRHDKKFLILRITCVVSGFMVKIASCKLPRKESMTRAPDIIKTPIELKLGDVCASAKVKRISPTTRSTAETYSWNGYFLLKPGMKAPIIMTGSTWILV